MDREMVERHLRLAGRHVAPGEPHIASPSAALWPGWNGIVVTHLRHGDCLPISRPCKSSILPIVTGSKGSLLTPAGN